MLAIHAELEPDRLPDSLLDEPVDAGVAVPVEAPKDPLAELPNEAEYPVAGFTVSAKKHAFLVPPSKAARLRLDPKKTYKVWTEGRLSFGGLIDNVYVTECAFFLEGVPPLQSKDSFGIVGPKGTIVKNATALYAWVTDEVANDNTGAIKVRVMDTASKQTSTVLVDGKSNSFAPELANRFTLRRLEPLNTYDVKLKEGKPPARTLGDKGGTVKKVLMRIEPGWNKAVQARKHSNDLQRMLEAGKTVRLNGATGFWLSFPDDGVDDNSGSLEVEVSSVAGLNGLLNSLVPNRNK
jgi:hypothetical protein